MSTPITTDETDIEIRYADLSAQPGTRAVDAERPDPTVAVANLIRFLETGAVPDGLLAPDVFAERVGGHPFPGQVRVERVERTDHGFTIEFEERWDNEGQRWYCRELSIYCTGDWDQAGSGNTPRPYS